MCGVLFIDRKKRVEAREHLAESLHWCRHLVSPITQDTPDAGSELSLEYQTHLQLLETRRILLASMDWS